MHTGSIIIEVCGDTDEGTASAIIKAGTVAPADWTTLTMQPVGGAARTITGNTTAGTPLIYMDGVDGMVIDGLNSGGNSLTFSNTRVSPTASTSTFFFDGATGNTVTNSTILGSGTGASTGNIVLLGDASVTPTGNDNNIISNNNIGPAGANSPANGIFSSGTTTTQATRNSGLQIINNNIYDFFTNTAVIANGVLVSGTTDTTITGNSFYQTATRTMSFAASGFIGISIADTSSVNNNVSNNFIGGERCLSCSAAWTQTGAVTHYVIGIRMSVGSATASSLQNNVIRNLNISTSTTSTINAGISAVTGAMNIGTTTGNTIGASTGTGSITWTAAATNRFSGIQAGTGTPNGIIISNNNIGSITLAGAGSTTFYGIRMEGVATAAYTVSGNTIGSTSTANSITSAANTAYVGISGTNTGFPATVSNNTIPELTIHQHRNIGLTTRYRTYRFDQRANNIGEHDRELFDNKYQYRNDRHRVRKRYCFERLGHEGNTITANTIRDLANTTSGATAVFNNGIYIGSTPGTTISRNFIYNLTTASTSATSSIQGIYLFNSSATINIYNNMLRLGTGVGNNPIIRGIRDNTATGSPTNIIHNSIFIDGTQGAATVNTNCIVRDLASTMTIRNNILWNNRASTGAPGAQVGRHYGIQNTSATGTFVSNNNVIYTPNIGGAIGQSGALDRITLANWQAAASQDLNSFNSDPQFIDATNATTPDLHIHPTNVTIVEGNGGAVAAPTDDFDAQTRSGLTPVDIGADAGNFVGLDLSAPGIVYTALANTSSTANRVLSVTITDVTGVDQTATFLPRMYFNKNAGAYFSTQCVVTGGTPQNGTYDCTIDNGLIGGVVGPDVIRYHVVAQDTLGNLSSNPSAGFTGTNVNSVTPPTTPNQYTIIPPPLSGDYLIPGGYCDLDCGGC